MSLLKKLFRAGRSRPALDPNDICCEIFNPGKEPITFKSYHVNRDNHCFIDPRTGIQHGPKHWLLAVCKPGEWVFLPHQYYKGEVPSGSKEITVIKNFGDEMFRGNKFPSPPENRKTLFRGF